MKETALPQNMRITGHFHNVKEVKFTVASLVAPQYYASAGKGTSFHFTSIFRECMNCNSRWSETRDTGQPVTIHSSQGYLDFPLMPSRRAFMLGKTFFIIFPKSAALSGW